MFRFRPQNIFIEYKVKTDDLDKVDKQFREQAKQAGLTEKEVEKLNKSLSDFGRQGQKSLKSVNSGFSQLKDFVAGGLIVGGIEGIASAASDAVGELARMAVTLEGQAAKAAIVLGDQLGFVTEKAKELAASLGLTQLQFISATARASDLLIPLGFSREAASRLSVELVSLSGALSAWSDGQFDATQVSEILQKALLGEREQLKSLGISISEYDVQQRLVTNGTKDLTGAALQRAKAEATVQLILEKSVDAQTSFAESSGSLQSKLGELRSELESVREQAALRLLPSLIRLTDFLLELIDRADEVGEGFEPVVNVISRFVDEIEKTLSLTGVLESDLKAIDIVVEGLKGTFELATFSFRVVLTVITQLLRAFNRLNELAGGVAGVFIQVRREISNLFNDLSNFDFSGVIDRLFDAFSSGRTVVRAKQNASQLVTNIRKAIQDASEKENFTQVGQAIAGQIYSQMQRGVLSQKQAQQLLLELDKLLIEELNKNNTQGTIQATTEDAVKLIEKAGDEGRDLSDIIISAIEDQNAAIIRLGEEQLNASADISAQRIEQAKREADAIEEIERQKAERIRQQELELQLERINAAGSTIGAIQSLFEADASARIAIANGNEEEIAKIRLQEFRRNKLLRLAEIPIDVARSIIRIQAQLGIASAPAIALAIANGLAQTAAIAAQRPPAFKDGIVEFRGAGSETSDSNLALISDRESVITAKGTKKNKKVLERINKGEQLQPFVGADGQLFYAFDTDTSITSPVAKRASMRLQPLSLKSTSSVESTKAKINSQANQIDYEKLSKLIAQEMQKAQWGRNSTDKLSLRELQQILKELKNRN